MTKKILDRMVQDQYLYLMRVSENEFGATKSALPTNNDTDYDIFVLNKSENLNGITIGTVYSVKDLVDKKNLKML